MRKIYLFLLAALIGIEIALGAFVAPMLFFPQKFIGEGVLTHFQSGVLMTQIFLKYNYVLLGVSAFAFIFDLFGLKQKECMHVKISAFALSFISFTLALAFVFYFTEFIVQAQAIGEVATKGNAEFDAIHATSELVMKLMMIAQTILFFLRAYTKPSEV
ncbi:MAG: DUF4149 domain-containing protein [Campylobacter sp.]|nr:DUF4149 domain-containing protein [Campylobacter sp.]